jgi:hypothetical protein
MGQGTWPFFLGNESVTVVWARIEERKSMVGRGEAMAYLLLLVLSLFKSPAFPPPPSSVFSYYHQLAPTHPLNIEIV